MGVLYQLNRVTFGYTESTILDIDKKNIEKGTITALVGPNGSGKSTLLGLLAFLYFPLSGEIKFHDKIVNESTLPIYRKKVGFIQQNPYLIRGTVYKNIELGLKFHGIDVHERKKRIKNIINQLDIEPLINRSVRSLSGGEAQKVAIARSLVLEPEVLLLDEPFTYLDQKFVKELEKLIVHLKTDQNKTVIFTTHNTLQAQVLSDKVYSMVNGDIVEASLINLFYGHVDQTKNLFDTGRLKIALPDDFETCEMIVIEAIHVVISRTDIHSSMRNTFKGSIKSIDHYDHNIQVKIEAGEIFTAIITNSAQKELNFKEGDIIWVSFKSTSIKPIR